MRKQLLFISIVLILGLGAIAQTTIRGCDVSSYQATPNWTQVKATGIVFAIAKASEGITIKDASFISNMVNGTAAGVVMGSYHFARPENNSATAEANYFVSVAGPYIKSGNLPPALDLEDPPSGTALTSYFSSANLTAWVQTWMTTVKTATGITPLLYTSGGIANYLNSSLTAYGLWTADPDGSISAVPSKTYLGAWPAETIKQYSFTGSVSGITTGSVDLDVFNGTQAAFNILIGGGSKVTPNFISDVRSGCSGMTVNYTDKSTSTGTISSYKWTFQGGNPATSTVKNPSVIYSSSGSFNVKEVVTSSTGKDSITDIAYIDVIPSGTLPLAETFQSGPFPPAGWTINTQRPGDSIWELCTTNGYSSTQCMYFPANCGNISNIAGERSRLYTPDYSFAGMVNAYLSFDVAYEPSNLTTTPAYSDTLVVYSSTDCGKTWTSIYSKGGATLCTTGSTTSAKTDVNSAGCFFPPIPSTSAAWRKDSVSLSALNNQTNVMFSLESRSGWGNIIYIDNINIPSSPTTSIQNLSESSGVKVYPNPNNGSFNILFPGTPTEKTQVMIYDALGRQVYLAPVNTGITQVTLDARPAGIYFYRIMTESGGRLISEGKLIVQ